MNLSQQMLLAQAMGLLSFSGNDAVRSMLTQAGFPTGGFISPESATPFADAVWSAGLLSIATTAATALGGGATGATVLANWQEGNVASELSYGDVSGTASGVALWNALYTLAG